MSIRPFKLEISAEQLDDLHRRVRASLLPNTLSPGSWDDGTDTIFLRRLLDYWCNQFDWRCQEQRINQMPQFLADIDGQTIHFVHQRGIGPKPMPLILTHGWPGSFLEMERLLPLLTDPAKYGGNAEDAFDVVVPSLPGYGCSPAPTRTGISSKQIADMWALLADSTPSGHPVRSHLARHSRAIWPPVPRPSGRAVGAQRRRGGIVSPGWLASSISASVCALIHPSD